jgi:hypothetical protein
MRKLASAIVLALLLAAPAASTNVTGLRGVVKVPKPVCLQDDPCDGSAPGVTIAFWRDGRLVKRVTSGTGGRYRVTLVSGTYSVTSPSMRSRVLPSRVRVFAGSLRHVDFFVDNGIRAP